MAENSAANGQLASAMMMPRACRTARDVDRDEEHEHAPARDVLKRFLAHADRVLEHGAAVEGRERGWN